MPTSSKSRAHFIRDLVLVSLLLAGAVVTAVVFFSLRAREDISQKFIDNATSSAERQFVGMADKTEQTLELAADWAAAGKIALPPAQGMNDLLVPLLRHNRLLSGISVADAQGNSYYLAARDDGFMTREISGSGTGRKALRRYWDADRKPLSEEEGPADYDPRSRPWFAPALSTDGIFWTQPYVFFENKVAGITASIARNAPNGGGRLVVAIDVLLDDLFREIQSMAPSANSRVFVFRNDARIYVSGGEGVPSDFRTTVEIGDPLIQKMVASWEKRLLPNDAAFTVQHDQETWWCGFRPMEDADRHVWVGVMVPEADIMGSVGRRWKGLWALGGIVVLLAAGLIFFMLRRYGRSIDIPEHEFDHRDPEQSIRAIIGAGEGRTIEFKSTMRLNLHTQKPGKEIELAWLKALVAFMNTDGGILLLGVSDEGIVSGLEADGFASEDKCRLHFKNLVNQHIGAEFSKYLRLHLVRVDGQQVGVVACRRAGEPAYLKTPKSEEFYIRSGPSSDALPVSKVVAYIRTRK